MKDPIKIAMLVVTAIWLAVIVLWGGFNIVEAIMYGGEWIFPVMAVAIVYGMVCPSVPYAIVMIALFVISHVRR